MKGIEVTLLELAEDEGAQNALRVAERWRNTLEDIGEAANPEQRGAIMVLMKSLNFVIDRLLEALLK